MNAPAPAPSPFPVLIRKSPPSVRLVFACVHLGAGRATTEITACSGLPARTVREAVRWLERQGIAERIAHLGDARGNIIVLKPDPTECAFSSIRKGFGKPWFLRRGKRPAREWAASGGYPS